MNGFVLDTSVLSAFAPGKPQISRSVLAWFEHRDEQLYVSVAALAEVTQGISKLRRLGSEKRAQIFAHWLDGIVEQFGDRVLSFEERAARLAGELSDGAEAIGRHPGFLDIAIAATAAAHDMAVLTRNLRHFEPLGVPALDPLSPDFPRR